MEKKPKQQAILYRTKYGHFSEDGKEFVITKPDTPSCWINVLSNKEYGLTFSSTGTGYSWLDHARINRITRWEQDLVKDEWGKFIYLRDNKTGGRWSLCYKPTCYLPDSYEVRHGIGYSKVKSVYKEIESNLLIFVHPFENVEIWQVKIKNLSPYRRSIGAFSYFEWCLGESPDWHRELHKTFFETSYNKSLQSIFATKRAWQIPSKDDGFLNSDWDYTAFHSVNEEPASYTTSKESFLSMHRSIVNPKAVENGICIPDEGKWLDAIGSLHVNLELEENEEKTVVFLLGATKTKSQATQIINKFKEPKEVDEALYDLKIYWEDILNKNSISTPDKHIDILTNTWLKYQAISCRMWARTAYYQTGGAFGFRDQLQDSMLFLPLDPELTKKQILLHAAHQYKDGVVQHWWDPVIEQGYRSVHTDDLLWLAFVLVDYLKETKDLEILNEMVPFIDSPEEESVFEHAKRGIDKVLSRFSKGGLPLIGEGDWNDGLSNVGSKGQGESVWLGQFLCYILHEFSEVCELIEKDDISDQYLQKAKTLKTAINKHGWDGSYFMRATKDDGSPLGSKKCKEGKIFLNAQTWSIISGSATGEHAKKAMDSARRYLYREYGPLLFNPAYTTPDASIGYVTRYAPGVRENGGVYTHAACWAIMAECMLKKADNAYELYTKLSPILRSHNNPDLYKTEPYVLPGNTDGPESPYFGRGGWSWYTGSSAWLFKVLTEYMLGIRPTYEGLLIDPCIPRTWSHFKVRRLFRNAIYLIDVENPRHVSHGVRSITINSKYQRSNLITPQEENKVHRVKVVMG